MDNVGMNISRPQNAAWCAFENNCVPPFYIYNEDIGRVCLQYVGENVTIKEFSIDYYEKIDLNAKTCNISFREVL